MNDEIDDSSFMAELDNVCGMVESDYNKNHSSNLESLGLSPPLCESFRKLGIANLFQWQKDCLTSTGVLDGCNLLYSAPTSGGKTLIAEIVILRSILRTKKKALFVAPFVSIASEKLRRFNKLVHLHNKFMPQFNSIKVTSFFGKKNIHNFFKTNIAICTIEKANSIINLLLDQKKYRELCVVVIDEMHMIADPDRGYLVELLVAKIAQINEISRSLSSFSSRYCDFIQVIGLSATMPNQHQVAKWMSASLFQTDSRPVELCEFIVSDGKVYDKNNDLKETLTKPVDIIGMSKDSIDLIALVISCVKQGKKILVFCHSRRATESCASLLTDKHDVVFQSNQLSQSQSDSSTRFKSMIDSVESRKGKIDDLLQKCLSSQIGYHHAGLSEYEKDIVEKGFLEGFVKILVATSTLSAGVNLPADVVIIRSTSTIASFHVKDKFNSPVLDVPKYRQMAGRAGRLGVSKLGTGEVFIVCLVASEVAKSRQLLNATLPPMISYFNPDLDRGRAMTRALLEMVVVGIVSQFDDIPKFLLSILAWHQSEDDESKSKLENHTKDSLLYLIESHCIEITGESISQSPRVEGLVVDGMDDTKQNSDEYDDERYEHVSMPLGVLEKENDPGDALLNQLSQLSQVNDLDLLNKNWPSKKVNPTKLGLAIFFSGFSPEEGLVMAYETQKMLKNVILKSDLHIMYCCTPITLQSQGMPDFERLWRIYERSRNQNSDAYRVYEAVGISIGQLSQWSQYPPSKQEVSLASDLFLLHIAQVKESEFQSAKNKRRMAVDETKVNQTNDVKLSGMSKAQERASQLSSKLSMILNYFRLRRLYMAMALCELDSSSSSSSRNQQLRSISSAFSIHAGELQAIQSSAGSIVSMQTKFCTHLGWHCGSSLFKSFGESHYIFCDEKSRAMFVKKEKFKELLDVDGVSQKMAEALYSEGITTQQELARASITVVAVLLQLHCPFVCGEVKAANQSKSVIDLKKWENLEKIAQKIIQTAQALTGITEQIPEEDLQTMVEDEFEFLAYIGQDHQPQESVTEEWKMIDSGQVKVSGRRSMEFDELCVSYNAFDKGIESKKRKLGDVDDGSDDDEEEEEDSTQSEEELNEDDDDDFSDSSSEESEDIESDGLIGACEEDDYSSAVFRCKVCDVIPIRRLRESLQGIHGDSLSFQKRITENESTGEIMELSTDICSLSALLNAGTLEKSNSMVIESKNDIEHTIIKSSGGCRRRKSSIQEISSYLRAEIGQDPQLDMNLPVSVSSVGFSEVFPNDCPPMPFVDDLSNRPTSSAFKGPCDRAVVTHIAVHHDTNRFVTHDFQCFDLSRDGPHVTDFCQLVASASIVSIALRFQAPPKHVLWNGYVRQPMNHDVNCGPFWKLAETTWSRIITSDMPVVETVVSEAPSNASKKMVLVGVCFSFGGPCAYHLPLPSPLPVIGQWIGVNLVHESPNDFFSSHGSRSLLPRDDCPVVSDKSSIKPLHKRKAAICNTFATLPLRPAILITQYIGFGKLLHKCDQLVTCMKSLNVQSLDDCQENPLLFACKRWCSICRLGMQLLWESCSYEWKILKSILSKSSMMKTAFDMKSTLICLKQRGVEVSGDMEDPLVADWLIHPDGSSVKNKMKRGLYIKFPDSLQRNDDDDDVYDRQIELDRCCYLSISSMVLMRDLEIQLEKFRLSSPFRAVEMPFIKIAADIAYGGISISKMWYLSPRQKVKDAIVATEEEIAKENGGIGVNLNSLVSIHDFLYHKLLLSPPSDWKTSMRSIGSLVDEEDGCESLLVLGPTNTSYLEQMTCQHRVISLILRWRVLNHCLVSLRPLFSLPEIHPIIGGLRIRSVVDTTSSSTGRVKILSPPLQQIAKTVTIPVVSRQSVKEELNACSWIPANDEMKAIQVLEYRPNNSSSQPIEPVASKPERRGFVKQTGMLVKGRDGILKPIPEKAECNVAIYSYRKWFVGNVPVSVTIEGKGSIIGNMVALTDISSDNAMPEFDIVGMKDETEASMIILKSREGESASNIHCNNAEKSLMALVCCGNNDMFPFSSDSLSRIAADMNLVDWPDNSFTFSPRDGLIAPKGKVFISVDYSQIELRLLAHFSMDEKLCELFTQDVDVFRLMASRLTQKPAELVSTEDRQAAKQVCYGILYGQGSQSLCENDRSRTTSEAINLKNNFLREFTGIRSFIQLVKNKCKSDGFVTSILGRRRYLPDIRSNSLKDRNRAERQAVNTICQASAADLIKVASINIDKRLKSDCQLIAGGPYVTDEAPCRLVIQIHDELIYEVDAVRANQVSAMLQDAMLNAIKLRVPLKVNVKNGKSWGQCK